MLKLLPLLPILFSVVGVALGATVPNAITDQQEEQQQPRQHSSLPATPVSRELF